MIAEDWCSEAANLVPLLARLGDLADCLDLRVIKRDDHPAVMDRYLTNGARAIPVVIAIVGDFDELGHWGPRPAELQDWVMQSKRTMPRTKLYAEARRWYARDRGETTLREVLAVLGGESSVKRIA